MIELKTGGQYIAEIRSKKFNQKHTDHIMRVLNDIGTEIKRELEDVTSVSNRSGRTYYYRGVKYQASAPGEPPAKRSGRLNESFGLITNIKQMTIYNSAKSDKGFPYPLALDTGTSRMAPRPYFLKTIESFHGVIAQELQDLR
jgi:hypothetical protein